MTHLYWAAERGWGDEIAALVKECADPDVVNDSGDTPLMEAVVNRGPSAAAEGCPRAERPDNRLGVKAIAHGGPFLLKKVAGFRGIAGQAVVGEHMGLELQSHSERGKDLGETGVWAHFPRDHSLTQMPPEDGHFTRLCKMQKYFAAPRDRAADARRNMATGIGIPKQRSAWLR